MSVSVTVKNIPEELYEKLKARAEAERRSMNSEVISILGEALAVHPVKPEDMIAAARALRGRTSGGMIDEKFLKEAKKEGRP